MVLIMYVIFCAKGKLVMVDPDHCQIHVECEVRGAGVYDYDDEDPDSFASAMRDAMNELTAT